MADESINLSGQRAIEERLRASLDKAKANYDQSLKTYKLAQECYQDVGYPDGTLALRQACAEHKQFMDEYIQALREFNKFVIHRCAP